MAEIIHLRHPVWRIKQACDLSLIWREPDSAEAFKVCIECVRVHAEEAGYSMQLPMVEHPGAPDLCVYCAHAIGIHQFDTGKCTVIGCSCEFAQKPVEAHAAEQMRWGDQEQDDPVNHPSHYTQYKGLEIIDLTEQMNFCRGNAVKYIARAGLKNPETELEDLKKARWYISREIERLKKNPKEDD